MSDRVEIGTVLAGARAFQDEVNEILGLGAAESTADEPGAYERLREIARLRGELNEIDLSIAAAKRAHERCKEYLELKDLREERKEIAAQLDVAELNAVQWSQSRLGL